LVRLASKLPDHVPIVTQLAEPGQSRACCGERVFMRARNFESNQCLLEGGTGEIYIQHMYLLFKGTFA
jgi:hypothetical protein